MNIGIGIGLFAGGVVMAYLSILLALAIVSVGAPEQQRSEDKK